MNKIYVEFFFPGSFVPESTIRQVDDRSPPTDVPKGCYGYRYFSRSEVEVDGEVLRGEPKVCSGMFYFGEALTLADVGKLPGTDILQSNMKGNGWGKVVRTVRGNFQPLYERDTVIPPKVSHD